MSNLQICISYKIHTMYKLPSIQEITILQKNISTFNKNIPYATYEIRSHVLLPWDVFHSKEEFLDCYRPPTCKHSAVLVLGIL